MAAGLLISQPSWLHQGWMHAKLGFVAALLAYHWFCYRLMGHLHRGECQWSGRQLRALNELPTLLLVIVVMLVIVFPPCPASTVPSNVSVALAPLLSVPMLHAPVAELYEPCEVVPLAAVAVSPLGSRSLSETFVARAAPVLETSIWKVTVSPSSGVASPLASVFTVTKLASLLTVTVSS